MRALAGGLWAANSRLREKYCPEGRTYIAKMQLPAELFSVSESSVKNYFYGVFGQSISKYLTHRRMLRAAELLKTTDCSVLEVANQVGYLNQSKFAAAFRREHAVTPLEYRRKARL